MIANIFMVEAEAATANRWGWSKREKRKATEIFPSKRKCSTELFCLRRFTCPARLWFLRAIWFGRHVAAVLKFNLHLFDLILSSPDTSLCISRSRVYFEKLVRIGWLSATNTVPRAKNVDFLHKIKNFTLFHILT